MHVHAGLCVQSVGSSAHGADGHHFGRLAAAGPGQAAGAGVAGRGGSPAAVAAPLGGRVAAAEAGTRKRVPRRPHGYDAPRAGDLAVCGRGPAPGPPHAGPPAPRPLPGQHLAAERPDCGRRRSGRGDGRAGGRLRRADGPHGRGGREYGKPRAGPRPVGRLPGTLTATERPRHWRTALSGRRVCHGVGRDGIPDDGRGTDAVDEPRRGRADAALADPGAEGPQRLPACARPAGAVFGTGCCCGCHSSVPWPAAKPSPGWPPRSPR